MKQVVQTNPMAFRHVFTTWSAARLAQHLAKVTGIHFSDDQLRRLLHQGVFSVNRPKHALKGKCDEQAYQKAKKNLIGSKKKMRDDAEEALLFRDEMGIHRHPTLTRMWGLAGHQSEVPAPGKNQKQVVYGRVDKKTGKITYTVAKTKSGQNSLVFLVTAVAAYAG